MAGTAVSEGGKGEREEERGEKHEAGAEAHGLSSLRALAGAAAHGPASLSRQDSTRSRGSNRSNRSGAGQSGSEGSSRSSRLPPSPVKVWCCRLVKARSFNAFLYLCIAFNTVTIGMNDLDVERNNAHRLRGVVKISDWAVLGVFTVEMFLKMYAWGLRSRNAVEREDFDAAQDEDEEQTGYFSSYWNVFDCAIVVIGWATAPLIFMNNLDPLVGRLAHHRCGHLAPAVAVDSGQKSVSAVDAGCASSVCGGGGRRQGFGTHDSARGVAPESAGWARP